MPGHACAGADPVLTSVCLQTGGAFALDLRLITKSTLPFCNEKKGRKTVGGGVRRNARRDRRQTRQADWTADRRRCKQIRITAQQRAQAERQDGNVSATWEVKPASKESREMKLAEIKTPYKTDDSHCANHRCCSQTLRCVMLVCSASAAMCFRPWWGAVLCNARQKICWDDSSQAWSREYILSISLWWFFFHLHAVVLKSRTQISMWEKDLAWDPTYMLSSVKLVLVKNADETERPPQGDIWVDVNQLTGGS